MTRIRIAVTPGDPSGIGPEIAVAGLAALLSDPVRSASVDEARLGLYDALDRGEGPEWILLGDAGLWERAARCRSVELGSLRGVTLLAANPEADPRFRGLAEIEALATGIQGCLTGRFSALCTGPLHKASLLERGFPYAGHTPYLSDRCGLEPDDAVMVFVSDRLVVALATGHIPLSEVPARLDAASLVRAAKAGCGVLKDGLGRRSPRVALCGLNPHAGEEGRLGSEEGQVHAEAIQRCIEAGIDATGPYPADSIFARAAAGSFDLVVACYHDQGLAPIKTLDFGRSVHISGGLPIVRTSVDHGTARDIAWLGKADSKPMEQALSLAFGMAAKRTVIQPQVANMRSVAAARSVEA